MKKIVNLSHAIISIPLFLYFKRYSINTLHFNFCQLFFVIKMSLKQLNIPPFKYFANKVVAFMCNKGGNLFFSTVISFYLENFALPCRNSCLAVLLTARCRPGGESRPVSRLHLWIAAFSACLFEYDVLSSRG